ncbi:MAG: type II toxin-antitoxin system YafQ family toxin [Parachlamydiaceae bacterium]
MRVLERSTQFKKDIKKALKQTSPKRDIEGLLQVLNMLAEDVKLPPEKLDHALVGSWVGYRECHIQPDFLLIYKKDNKNHSIRFERVGSHSDLF